MGIYIKGIDMPTNCIECKLSALDPFGVPYCVMEMEQIIDGEIRSDCPLTEVSEPHGRLIDADACIDDIRNNNQQAWEALAYAPTVIESEAEECG